MHLNFFFRKEKSLRIGHIFWSDLFRSTIMGLEFPKRKSIGPLCLIIPINIYINKKFTEFFLRYSL